MLRKAKSVLRSKKGESEYISVCIAFICLMMVLVFTINVYSFFTLKDDMNEIAGSLADYAGITGSVGPDFDQIVAAKQELYNFDFWVTTTGSQIYAGTVDQIDRGDRVQINVTVIHHLSGLGIVNNIPIPCTVTKTTVSTRTSMGYIPTT